MILTGTKCQYAPQKKKRKCVKCGNLTIFSPGLLCFQPSEIVHSPCPPLYQNAFCRKTKNRRTHEMEIYLDAKVITLESELIL